MKRKNCILIVDDEPMVIRTISRILETNGFDCLGVGTGKEAIEKIKEVEPVVAIIDLKLDDMSGMDVIAEIKKRLPGTECIVLTGYATTKSVIESVRLDAYSYLQKPCDMQQLLRTVHMAAEKRRTEDALRLAEQSFHNVVNKIADGIVIVNGNGVIRFINPAAEVLLGKKSEQLLEEAFGFPVSSGETSEISIIHQDEEAGTGEMRVVETEWQGEPAVLISIRDITRRKLTEEDLRAFLEELQTFTKVAVDREERMAELKKKIEELKRELATRNTERRTRKGRH